MRLRHAALYCMPTCACPSAKRLTATSSTLPPRIQAEQPQIHSHEGETLVCTQSCLYPPICTFCLPHLHPPMHVLLASFPTHTHVLLAPSLIHMHVLLAPPLTCTHGMLAPSPTHTYVLRDLSPTCTSSVLAVLALPAAGKGAGFLRLLCCCCCCCCCCCARTHACMHR